MCLSVQCAAKVRAFVDDAYKKTLALVEKHKDRITAMAQDLLQKEVGVVQEACVALMCRAYVCNSFGLRWACGILCGLARA